MERNVGVTDRNVRIVVGIVLAALGVGVFAGPLAAWGTVVGAIAILAGLILLGTGLTQRCLLYIPFGMDTGRGG
ncbi:MAG: DUF2892 domain-containing protein [Halodesulfurarchaeum sp.]